MESARVRRVAARTMHTLSSRPNDMVQHVATFLNSKHLQTWQESYRAQLEQQLRNKELTAEVARNGAMATLLLATGGHRGVALMNLTREEWEGLESTRSETGKTIWTIYVQAHKTSRVYGAAPLVLTRPWVHEVLKTYYKFARPLLLGKKGETVDLGMQVV